MDRCSIPALDSPIRLHSSINSPDSEVSTEASGGRSGCLGSNSLLAKEVLVHIADSSGSLQSSASTDAAVSTYTQRAFL